MNAFRKLVKMNGYQSIFQKLQKINSTQTKFKEKQEIDLEGFIEWRDKVLGISEELPPCSDINVRRSWLWVLGMQIFYGLRISEVFAIKNLDKPAYDEKTNKLIVHPYNDPIKNPHRIIFVGEKTIIGTTTKTGARPVKPMESLKYPNLYFQFVAPCNFDTSADNTEEILYCENTDIYFQTFGNDLVFNNSNTASSDSAIKLVKAQGKFEKCTVNDIGTFVIADDRSFVINTFNSHVMTNVTTYYDLRNNSFLRTNRYSIFGEPEILMDGTSTMNNLILFDKTLINPPLNSSIKLINNAPKDYYVDFNGWSGVAVNMTYELYADGDTLNSQNNKLAKGRDLSINFSGTTSIDHVVLGFHLHDFV